MLKRSNGVALIVAMAVVWAVAATVNRAGPIGPAPAPGGTSVAVVNIVTAFNKFEQTDAINRKMTDHRNNLGQEADKRQGKIKSLRNTREAFQADSKEWFAKDEELRKSQFEYEVWQSVEKDRVVDAHKRWIKRTYKMITDEVQRVAQAKGYQLVMTVEDLDEETEDTKALLRQIFNRKVVYSDGAVDITQEVLKNLNGAFEKAGGAAAVDFLK